MGGIKAQYNAERRYIEYAVDEYGQMLFRICFSILCNKDDAEDAMQETYIRYMTKAPLFKDCDHEKAWLIKVATNVSKNMMRYRTRHETVGLEQLKQVGIRAEDYGIFEAIMRLPTKYKTVLELYYLEGYKSDEIANILGLSPAAVRKRLQYSRRMLKDELEKEVF